MPSRPGYSWWASRSSAIGSSANSTVSIGAWPWAVLLTTPLLTAGIVWSTLRFFPGAGGSGIPQIKAALHPALPEERRFMFASLRLTVAKIGLGVAGFAAGLSIGREGPSVQVAAGVMQHARRWLSPNTAIDGRALLVAGGAAGIAAAFNAPLAGVVFAIEELSGRLEARASGLIITAIVLAGLVAVSAFGNLSYFGVIRVPRMGWDALGPACWWRWLSGVAGGLFARLLIASLTGAPGRLNRWRARWPVRFAAVGGLAVAVIGLATGGVTFGAGSEAVKQMLAGQRRTDAALHAAQVHRHLADRLVRRAGRHLRAVAVDRRRHRQRDRPARRSRDLGTGVDRHGHGRLSLPR